MTWLELLGKDCRGSRPRCVLLVDGSPDDVANRLTRLVNRLDVVVCSDDKWKPCGKSDVAEVQLDKADELVPCSDVRRCLRTWWLAANGRAMTPSWDIASTCTIKGKPGLLLVEAKAHVQELSPKSDACSSKNPKNRARIYRAILQANKAFRSATDRKWGLSMDHHYQLSNRFAWSWKLVSLGVPVVLVYLGFINAEDMCGKKLIRSDTDWKSTVTNYGCDIVDNDRWGKWLDFAGVPFLPLIRTCYQPFQSCGFGQVR